MLIHVSQEDIDTGEQNKCFLCPIALALFKATGERCEVTLDGFRTIHKSYPLPPSAIRFIIDFDTNKNLVAPFSFEVDI